MTEKSIKKLFDSIEQAEAPKKEAAAKAEAERAKAEEKRRIAAEKEAEKAKAKQKKISDRFLGNVVGSVGSVVGRKITDKILKDLLK